MTQPPNQPYNPNQPYGSGQGQPYGSGQGQPYDPAQAQQQYMAQQQQAAQQYAAQQQYEAEQEYMTQYETPKKRFGVRQILSIISAVVMVGAGGWFLWQRFQTNENLQVGNCLVITGTATNANEEKIDCSDKSKFSYEVSQTVSNTSSCPDNTTSYEISRKSRYGGSSTVKAVCLVPNLHQDVCYNESSSPIAPFDVAECGSAKVKVTKRVDQANASCEAGEDELTYTTPARTYCFGEPN